MAAAAEAEARAIFSKLESASARPLEEANERSIFQAEERESAIKLNLGAQIAEAIADDESDTHTHLLTQDKLVPTLQKYSEV